jgi:hypothetical protein
MGSIFSAVFGLGRIASDFRTAKCTSGMAPPTFAGELLGLVHAREPFTIYECMLHNTDVGYRDMDLNAQSKGNFAKGSRFNT